MGVALLLNSFHPMMHYIKFCLDYLVGWGLTSHLRIFQSYGNFTITGEGLQILTYTRDSKPLSIN